LFLKTESIFAEGTMLVLSRQKNKSIVINGDITVTILEIRDNQVKIGIDAPGEVPVHRQEVVDAMASERSHKASDKRTIVEACQ
jgi:carbon storage regulator